MQAAPRGDPFVLEGLLSRTLRLGASALPLVVPLALLLHVPDTFWQAVKAAPSDASSPASFFDPVSLVLLAFLGPLLPALVVPALLQRLAQSDAPLRPDWRGLSRRYLPALAASLVISVPMALLQLASTTATHAAAAPRLPVILLVVVLLPLDVWVSVRLFIAVAVALVELAAAPRALARSWRLTRGHVLGIFGVQLLLTAATVLTGLALKTLFQSLGAAHATDWGFGLSGDLAAPFHMALLAVLYHDLRRAGDGVDSAVIVAELG